VVQFIPVQRCVQLLESQTGATPSVGFVHGMLARAALGVGLVEATKHLIRDQVGPDRLPELRTLRPRLGELAEASHPLRLQADLAAAMLSAEAPLPGLYFVDDHFVPYEGAKPVGKGYATKRRHAQKGPADAVVTDYHGRAVYFVAGPPSGLTKTLPAALTQLRAITGPANIMLGFDRSGAYAQVFRHCRDQDADWLTYRRGGLTASTAPAALSECITCRGLQGGHEDDLRGGVRHAVVELIGVQTGIESHEHHAEGRSRYIDLDVLGGGLR
jgi:hypothetical protein